MVHSTILTIPFPRIPPEIFRIGPIALRWYGVMYVIGYAVGIWLARRRAKQGLVPLGAEAIDVLVGYLVIAMLLGARLVYVLVYDRPAYMAHPLDALAIWHGGLSFHGAVLGMSVATVLFARRHRVSFWSVLDLIAICGTPGLFFGRMGNFINGELYGRPSNVPWAMVFPTDPLRVPRHPSQLYEGICEGILLFLALTILDRISRQRGWYRPGLLAGAFLVGYGVFRFLLEFTRQPDAQLGLVLGPFSMGQLLSFLTIAAGAVIVLLRLRRT